MRKVILLAALLAPALLASIARAADPSLVAGVEKYLRDDEKAYLAAILIHPEVSAEFDAEAPLALKDPKNLAPFLGVWRAKLVAYAEINAKLPNPDLEAHYQDYAQLMTPEQRAFLIRRLPLLKEDERNDLIGYLGSVNDALAKYGTLTWYTKKVVAGIMDRFRQDLGEYVAAPIAQAAKRDAAASAAAFDAIKKADADSRAAQVAQTKTPPAPSPDVKPAVKPRDKPAPTTAPAVVPTKTPAATDSPGTVVSHAPAGGALGQLTGAADAGAQSGQNFDGGAGGAPSVAGGATIVPPTNGSHPSGLTPPSGDGKPSLVGNIPAVPSPGGDDGFINAIKKMQTKPAPSPLIKRIAPIGGGVLGGVLGGLIGLLLGGPIGALIGAAVGAAAGAYGGHLAGKFLFQ